MHKNGLELQRTFPSICHVSNCINGKPVKSCIDTTHPSTGQQNSRTVQTMQFFSKLSADLNSPHILHLSCLLLAVIPFIVSDPWGFGLGFLKHFWTNQCCTVFREPCKKQ